ncbi:MAG: metallophosphoesterase [Desulfovibrionaceae bacterium]|nr:metallophosphoesterase [Desulfovibrionaceae bacterium]
MFFLLLPGLICLYLFLRLLLPLPLRPRWKLALGSLLPLICLQQFLLRLFFGNGPTIEMPAFAVLLSGWSFASMLLLFCLTLGTDILLLARRLLRPKAKPSPTSGPLSPGRRQALLALLAIAPAAYGASKVMHSPEVFRLEARLPRLPRALDGLTLAQISDLHASSLLQEKWIRLVVEKTNALKPDLILLTGDIVDGLPEARRTDVLPLRELRAGLGVFGCAGNHEYYSHFDSWMKRFPDLGVDMLLNRHATLSLDGEKLVLAGVTDLVADRYKLPLPNVSAALAGSPEEGVRILLKHRPAGQEARLAGVDLQLSGHTHGGQILLLDQVVARFNQGYLRGWYQMGDMGLYVSSGAGLWSGMPVRLGVPSEIALLTLRRG